jgi:hypothetical protein
MKKSTILFFIFVIIILGCSNKHIDQRILIKLDSTLKARKDTFSFEKFDLDWDSLLILPPYTNLGQLKKSFNIDARKISLTGIDQRDDICLFVFMKSNNVISCIEFSRRTYDFSTLPIKYYSKESVFHILRDKSSTKLKYIIE